MPNTQSYDVLVIGAGMAGLAAARATAEAGLSTLLLEARERTGGRVHTLRTDSKVIELGAEFIHGRAPELWALIEEAGLATYERTGDFLTRSGDKLQPMDREEEGLLEGLETYPGPDCSFADYIARQPLSEAQRLRETSYVEGFNAANAREASVMALGRQQQAEDEIEGDRSWRIAEGYGRLAEFLEAKFSRAGGELLLQRPVSALRWGEFSNDGSPAEVVCADGPVVHARKVIVTLPLGVLQARTVRFEPDPGEILQAADAMRMGSAVRVTLVFRRRIWPVQMSFLLAQGELPNVWWSAHPAPSLTLTGWVGGPRAEALHRLAPAALQAHVLAVLAAALNLEQATVEAELLGFHTHDWSTDPWSRGAYSWVPVGGLQASARMSQPVRATLFFAGEHTDTTSHWGTVHAALRSGLRAARQVLQA